MFSSKVSKIVLGSVLALGLVVIYSVIRINGQEYSVETITYTGDNREAYCYNGVGGIETISSSDGSSFTCKTFDCDGYLSGSYSLPAPAGQGCQGFGMSGQDQFECTVNNCLAGTPTTGINETFDLVNDAVRGKKMIKSKR